jgi:menaquinone-9 beta-reductase
VAVLAGLGVHGVVEDHPPITHLRLVGPGGSVVSRALPRPAHTIPRRVFDERLVRAATAAGVELRRHTVRALTDTGAEVVVDGVIRAGVLIGADGAESVVRRALGRSPNPPGHLAVAIRGYAPTTNLTEQIIITTAQRWPAYAWEFPLGDGTANVGYGEVLRGVPLSRAYLLNRLAELLPGAEPTGVRGHHLPLSTRRPPPGRGRTLLAGDALSLINPFTGEGIFYAVLSGSIAGTVAAAGPERVADRYRTALRRRLGRHLRHSGVAAALTRRPQVVDAAVAAAARDGRVFDRMVDLGLGDGVFDARTIGRITARLGHRGPAAP